MDFSDLIDTRELHQLQERFPDSDLQEHVLQVSREHFEHWHEIMYSRRNRRGEVVLAIENSKEKFLLHTKAFYPKRIYRLPTGGIRFNEKVMDALQRETYEETSLPIAKSTLLSVIKTWFNHEDNKIPFVSYVFHLFCKDGNPTPVDAEEDIAGYRWVDLSELSKSAGDLLSCKGKWKDWGRFRGIPHDLVVKRLS